ncbi:MAG: ABC transporter ATP-binding protein [Gammaproteobacteria bacterium]
MPASLQLDRVAKRYGRHDVLNGVDLVVEPQEFIALVGINGAGKTTLIKALLDFCAIDGGTIQIFGIDHRQTEARARLAFLPERFIPPSFATGWEFLRYMGRLYGKRLRAQQVEEFVAQLNLDLESLAKPVRELSKGTAQKLGLAACMLSERELFVLDEPMTGLDPKARAMFKRYLLGLKGKGLSLFFSTHLLADVEQLCDRVAVLHQGRVCYAGSPQEFLAQYHGPTLEEAYLRCVHDEELGNAVLSPPRGARSRA